MNSERYKELQWEDSSEFTKEELEEGWHFCDEMDGLLCRKGSEDCFCSYRTEYN